MVQLMCKEQRRDLIVVNFLQAHGGLLLDEIRNAASQEQALAPLVDLDDNVLREWLMSIDSIDSKIGRRDLEEFFVKSRSPASFSRQVHESISPKTPVSNHRNESPKTPVNKRRNVSPASSPPPKRSFLPVLLQAAECRKNKKVLPLKSSLKKVSRQPHVISRQCQPYKTDAPNMYSAMLIGDDNFLNLAVFDLKFEANRRNGRRQSGGCVTGLRISEATRYVLGLNSDKVNHVILNVGSVDIAEGRPLVRLIMDYTELIRACKSKSIKPILTTLTPMPNCLHDSRKLALLGLNSFIINGYNDAFPVIDLYDGMTHEDGKVNWSLYQAEPRSIGGSRKAFVLWNSAGRQRVHKILEHDLGFAFLYKHRHVGFNF